MRKVLRILILAGFVSGNLYASSPEKEVPDSLKSWKKGAVSSLSFTQVSLTNWAAGGQNSSSGNMVLSAFANYKKEKLSWDNTFVLGYGLLKQGDDKSVIKTDDKIDLSSKFGYKMKKNLYLSALMNFKTQMTEGYNYPNDSVKISDFMAPAYLFTSVGLDYKWKERLSVFVSPVTAKMTIVNSDFLSDAGAFGVKVGEHFRNEMGGYIKMAYKQEVFKNVNLETKLDLFSNYVDNPQNIDVNWEVLVVMKINKFMTANFSTHLIYDDDVDVSIDNNGDGVIDEKGPRTQFKELLGVGLTYTF
jgi:hypothetical protein